MAVILNFMRLGTSFGPGEIKVMSEAFEKACARREADAGSPEFREALAAEIIALASDGTRDVDVLCDTALARIAGRP